MLPILTKKLQYSNCTDNNYSKMKNISKKMFRLSFGGSNDENSAQIPKGNKANIFFLL